MAAVTLSPCSMCCGSRRLRSVIVIQAQRGNWNRIRLSNFFFSKVWNISYRSKHKYSDNLLEQVEKYASARLENQSKLITKVAALMECDNVDDFIDKKSDEQVKKDLVLACKRFPSIILGDSRPVELYSNSKSYGESSSILKTPTDNSFLPTPMHGGWFDPDNLSRTLSSFCPELLQNDDSSDPREDILDDGSSFTSKTATSEVEATSDDVFAAQRFLATSIDSMPGLSKRHSNQLDSCGFHTMKKLLHHFPRTYADLQNAQVDIEDGQYLIFVGKVLSSKGVRASSSFSFLEVIVSCEVSGRDRTPEDLSHNAEDKAGKSIFLHLKKFFRGTRFTWQPFLNSIQEKHKVGDLVCISGKVKSLRAEDHFEMREYNIDVLKDEEESSHRAQGRPYPIYPSKGGLNPKFLSDVISRALRVLPANMDPIPKEITKVFGLPSLNDAYVGIHEPKTLDEADLARKRLIFDEFFYLQLARLYQMLQSLGTKIEKDVLLEKFRKPVLNSVYIEEWSTLTKSFLKALPYSLTPSQLSAVSEIIWDLKRPVPMNRLLQGDVGCGKTVVAFLACMEVIGSGYQAAFMAPTELLAIQHYEQCRDLLENMEGVSSKPTIGLLTGSTPAKQSRMIRQDLQSGAISFIIGTHSLIAEKIEYSALRIAVVDEQQRFGVIQRGKFNSKLYGTSMISKSGSSDSDDTSKADLSMAPHVLAMSATPIPRSLALALYGDISLTQITGMPLGRIPVETHIFEGNETGIKEVYSMMLEDLKSGGRVYVVYPVIDQSEQLPQLRAASAELEIVTKKFPKYNCGLLHGRMKSDDKEEALNKFRSGETQILLSTQVIEIGVDVPDASMMVVMNAERFGIAQLHQLRGRVGRGTRKSKCLLVGSSTNSLKRLNMLGKSSDGFYLANIDLLLRGPGDLLGKKQSGHLPEFPVARLEIDGNMLQEAHIAALNVLGDSHDLEKFPALKAELSMRQPLCLLGD
ncbi:DEAD/DEAH box RNA helicase family protein [Arabidopsis thaliana]|uniref:ATP-dependent DNA helicase homolog RECG1, chloroplastic/mitochondrial n=1 Tax=Arabidopsis thaliana TaxID=3702 RepID=RECG_ARATH|nr:DEAD/DEAH box RNA helicase family protein [Arabidopsis thaliana]F4INA9.1 RecName: Full=ATP-dependent DNA helicase homolog RECG, chloroplastic; Flags: Precursor [Arabidopsis thaliana]AEC05451.1 DEAD/DEAH box RNA helicase family protein [Arabidopsis thaliana]|eukprot:NP_178253.3 DEAD/DEAH box RNA helicase family protein [Arabidopsis thaliana]